MGFGKALKVARKKRGLTQRKLSSKIGISVGYLCDIEQDKKLAPKLKLVEKIEDALVITDNHLLLLASKERKKISPELEYKIKNYPRLFAFFNNITKDFTEDELDRLINYYNKLDKERK